ncbi:deoxyribose-phosphate aldolase [Membranicola marinus]|uniref:Deoxyribose-phosphate aldolase n=1 Tax=Membranihabitans marinus TaxID=1227546 RepID=A0A953HYM3_9BACT|nr:deoxyribose-phosphate aldolase [Membranihabitans marinus]MBY5958127.1 deoxyribose-phosphate aldolase [Membranihabitans marinus]
MDIRKHIDFTLLRPDLVYSTIDEHVDRAIEMGYYSVCVPPFFVEHIRRRVENERFKISTVVGFPNGFDSYKSKVEEIKEVISDGASEIDAVLNISAVKTEMWSYVDREIDSLSSMCRVKNAKLKLIADHNLLTRDELKIIVDYCVKYNVEYIKTGTGVYGDTTQEMVSFLKSLCPPELKIKAAGGIRTVEQAETLIKLGADRIGTSSLL